MSVCLASFLASPCFGSNFASTLLATLGFALVAFIFFALVLAIPLLRGRKANRRCACAASREALRLVKEREHAALLARRYSPETVDVTELPQASLELREYALGSRKDAS